jgi:dolichol kinase
MADVRSTDSNPIPFTQELLRKGTHVGALVIPAGYHILELSKLQMLAIMAPITVVMIALDVARLKNRWVWRSFVGRIWGRMVRDHEHAGNFTGATYILLSVCCTVALFERPVAVAALAFIIVGDTLAALIGRKFGRHRFGRKSVEGSSACLLGTLVVAMLTPGLPLLVACLGAVVATVVEALSFDIDDNISVPILSGLAMTLALAISSAA